MAGMIRGQDISSTANVQDRKKRVDQKNNLAFNQFLFSLDDGVHPAKSSTENS